MTRLLEWPKSGHRHHPIPVRTCGNRNCHSLLVGTQKVRHAGSLVVPYRTKLALTVGATSCAPRHLPKGVENVHV